MLLTRYVINQIQPFSTVLNCFKFNSTKVTNVQFNLFNFKAFSINSTIVRPNNEFPQPPVYLYLKFRVSVSCIVHESFNQIIKFLVSVETHNFLFHRNKLAHGPPSLECSWFYQINSRMTLPWHWFDGALPVIVQCRDRTEHSVGTERLVPFLCSALDLVSCSFGCTAVPGPGHNSDL